MSRPLRLSQAALLCIVLAGLVFVLDLHTPLGVADGILYVSVVLAAFAFPHPRAGLFVSAGCSVLIVLGLWWSPPGDLFFASVNRGLAITVLWLTAVLGAKRIKAEDKERTAEDRFKSQYEGNPIPTYTWRYDGRSFTLIDYNRASEALTKGRIKEWVGRTFEEMFTRHPDLHADLLRCVSEGRTVRREMVHTMVSTGEVKELDVTYVFIPPDVVMVHTQDMTDRKQAERDLLKTKQLLEGLAAERGASLVEAKAFLREEMAQRRAIEHALHLSEERFLRVFEQASVGLCLIDAETNLVKVNRAFCDLVGYAEDELIGRSYAVCSHPDDLETNLRLTREFAGGDRTGYSLDKRYIRKDGTIVWAHVAVTSIRFPGAEQPLGLAAVIDITARKAAEAELHDLMLKLEALVEERTRALQKANDALKAEMARREAIEASLRKSQSGLAEAQRIAHVGSWELDLQNHALVWSEEIYRIFEIDPTEARVSYDTFLAAVHPDDRAAVDRQYQASIRTRQPYEIVHRLLMRDGRVKFVHERGETFYDRDDRPRRTIGTVQDVTDRTLAEKALYQLQIELEERVARRTEELSVANLQLHAEMEERTRVQEALMRRDRILQAVSFAAKQFLLSPWSTDRLSEVLHRLGDAAEVDHVCIFKNEGDASQDLRTGLLAEWVASGITSRLDDQRLSRLSYREQGLGRWVAILSAGVPIAGAVREWPPAEQSFMGVRRQQVAALVPIFVGERWWGFMVFGLIRSERAWQGSEVEALQVAASTFGAGIQRRQMEEQIKAYTEDLEQLVEQRTTRVKELEAQRAQVDKLAAVGQLAAGVAHEINNPIAGIKNAFLVLKDGIPSDYPHYQFVGMIEREIERVIKIVRQMYALYRTGSTRHDEIALPTLVQDLVYLVNPKLAQKRIRLETAIAVPSTDSCQVPRDLSQVLLNLIQNAIDVSPADRVIRLEVGGVQGMARIKVVDQGPGIEPDVLPHIFEPFYSGKKIDAEPGMGLGLSVCYSLVQAMGGRIDVTTVVGQGTTFTVWVPYSTQARQTTDQGGST